MNEFIKKLCPLAAVVCFVLCITGAIGVLSNAQDALWQSVGLFFIGVSIFVLIMPLMSIGASAGSKPQTGTGAAAEVRKPFKPAEKPFRKDKPAEKQAEKPAAKPAARPAPKPAAKPADKPLPKAVDKPAVKAAEKPVEKPAVKAFDKPVMKNDDDYENMPDDQVPNNFDNADDEIRRDSGEQIAEDSGLTTLYVCNLSTDTTEVDLREEFEVFGPVKSVRLVTDKESGVSKGYAFVEMANKAEASLAIDDINGQEIKGQQVNVSFARKKPAFNRRWNNKR